MAPDDRIRAWFQSLGWEPFSFQEEAWRAYLDGANGLIHAPTGVGKTYAVWLGPLQEWLSENPEYLLQKPGASPGHFFETPALKVLWITPLRALAADTKASLERPVRNLGLPWTVELRTGDTPASQRQRQQRQPPTCLVTTPESLTLLLTYPDWRKQFQGLRCVICDEWHELMGTKRGVQVELALARLRMAIPKLRTWGLSATIGNLEEAMEMLTGTTRDNGRARACLIQGQYDKRIEIETLIPPTIDNFPWSGHMGLALLDRVIEKIETARSTLLFTNTRNQTEIWFQRILDRRPDLAGQIALHHGSIDREIRDEVERRLKGANEATQGNQAVPDGKGASSGKAADAATKAQSASGKMNARRKSFSAANPQTHGGQIARGAELSLRSQLREARERRALVPRQPQTTEPENNEDQPPANRKPQGLRCVVCTSSLDLGVDFTPVDQVIQVGSPKGIARLMQRAGRSGHQPGATSRIIGVPTNAFELVEFSAARDAMDHGKIESRKPVRRALDVLVQHLITCAMGGGFKEEELFEEVRTTLAYRDLNEQEWKWAVSFARQGGTVLNAYPEFRRLVANGKNGAWGVADKKIGHRHRMQVGTITSDAEVLVRLQQGGVLGTVEESFISRLKPGDSFMFAGRRLNLLRLKDLTATVKAAKSPTGFVPSWQGGRSPLSTELADAVLNKLADCRGPEVETSAGQSREIAAVAPILKIQQAWSRLPAAGTFLVEQVRVRRSHNWFFYPFAGRLVHEGLAALAAFRLSREEKLTIRTTPNDYGFALHLSRKTELDTNRLRRLFSLDDLLQDLLACMNETELARRQFREIARVAGLVMQGYPGQKKSERQLQSSSSLLFDVFSKYDPGNLLLDQARREILDRQLELTRLKAALEKIGDWEAEILELPRLTPLSFPLWADSLGETFSSESREDQLQRMLESLEEKAAE